MSTAGVSWPGGIGGDRIESGYDDLIVAAGVRLSYFGHPQSARWALV